MNTMEKVKERPILFSGEMVRVILDGRKTQTRRVLKLPKHADRDADWIKSVYQDGGGNWVAWSSDSVGHADFTKKAYPNGEGFPCPYGVVGDRLWVRETWTWDKDCIIGIEQKYKADYIPVPNWVDPNAKRYIESLKWKPSIFMPRSACRILLEVTGVRVERVQDISDKDCRAEGVAWDCVYGVRCNSGRCPTFKRDPYHLGTRDDFKRLWNAINSKRGYGWESNPFVWVVEFKRIEGGV